MKKFYLFFLMTISAITISFTLHAQQTFFSDAGANKLISTTGKRVIIPEKFRTVEVNTGQLRSFLWSLPAEKNIIWHRNQTPVLELPMPDGSMAKFHVWESSIQEPGLEAKFPEIKTFAGQGIDDPYATIRFDYSPYGGFHAQILSPSGRIYIDPYGRGDIHSCISYYTRDNKRYAPFVCQNPEHVGSRPSTVLAGPCRGTQLYTYRLAIACTGEYAVAVGGTTPALLHAAIVTSANRVDGVYESDLSIRMILIANNNLVEYLNAATDPFTGNNNANVLINESESVISSVIGNANFDIGHTFSTGGGGLAGLGVVCQNGDKASGITGSPSPVGDDYDIDYVAHEMGHQFGGDHSFNSSASNCGGGNRNGGTAYEIGSGTTIMAYAGICGNDDTQPHSDPFFHAISFDEISNYVEGAGGTCKVATATGNTLPVITSMSNSGVSIPLNTPFTLTGTATDADGDAITYCWEEWDLGPTTTWNGGNANTTSPLFKSRIPKTTGSRTFPDMSVILAGYPANPAGVMGGLKGETLPTSARTMKFRLTVRDNRAGGGGTVSGGSGCQIATTFPVTTVAGTGPFIVTVPNGGEIYAGSSSQTITWNVAGTAGAPISVANVKISLSTDGGLTYPTVIAASTPNDGTELVTIPNTPTTTARIKIEAIGNVFFDISNANFSITVPASTFGFNTPTAAVTACPAPATMTVNLSTTSTGGFSTPVNLVATGVPAGATISFGTNPVTPGNSTTVVLNNANTLAAGTYTVTITGTAGAIVNTQDVVYTINGGTGPTITGQPTNQSVCAGSNAVFTVTAGGATGYQWQVNTGSGYTNISGATAATYTVVGATAAQSGYQYQVIASTQCGSTTSTAATLTVNAAPAITSQPANTTACAGTNATFTVSATGAGLTYQWQISTDGCTTFNDIIGATSNSYTVVGVTNAMNGYGYKVVVSGTCAPSVSSNTCAILTVGNAASITSQPASTTVCVGANASFSVTATGSNLTYQWQVNTGTGFNNIAGATASTLNVPAVTAAMNGYQYLVNVYSCTAIPIVSTTATLTVNTPITISSQPSNVTLCSGSNASFSVTATGSNLTYQWQVNTGSGFNDIGGATSSTLNLAAVTAGMSGNQYHAVISGGCGAPVTSNDATLTVNTPVVISVQPADVSVCVPNSTTLSITASGTAITYQWQVSTDGGVTWSDLTDSTHSSITLTPSASMNGNQYQVILSGTCSASFASAAAILTVNTPVNIVDQPVSVNGCVGTDAVFSVNATGSTITYQWMGSVNGGPFTALTNTAPYSGVTTNTLTVSPTTTGLTGNQYFAVVSGVPCGNVFTDTVDLTIHDIPVVVLTAASFSTITPATPTTVYTTVSAPGNYTYQWFLNGNPIAATTASIPVDVSGLGDYEVIVTNTATGCTGRSNVANVHDSASNMVFVYPNPNTGSFQVRYYNANATATTYMLTIYDSKGSKVYTRNYPITNVYERMDVNMNNAESGLYFIDLRDTNGKRLGAVPFMIKR